MSFVQRTYDNADDSLAAACAALALHRGAGVIPVLLVPSVSAVARVRRYLVNGPGAFGVRVETPSSWIADRWELFGDGRCLVSAGTRELLVQRACVEAHQSADKGCVVPDPTPGVVNLLARLAREALPFLVSVDVDTSITRSLSMAERGVLCILNRYVELLEKRDLCEASQVAYLLPAVLNKVPPLVLWGFDELDCSSDALFHALSECADVLRLDDGCRAPVCDRCRAPELQDLLGRLFVSTLDAPVEATGCVQFLLPAGRYAVGALVLDTLVDTTEAERARALSEGREPLPVVVCARNPRARFDQLADALAVRGVTAAVSARRSFAQTAFGRAFLALLSFACDEDYRIPQATDFALSLFSGVSRRKAYDLDAAWRGNRAVKRSDITSDLAQASDAAANALEALARGDIDTVLTVFEERIVRLVDLDAAFRSEQLAAIAVVRSFVVACYSAEVSFLEARGLLASAAVSAVATTALSSDKRPAAADVLFMSLQEAAEQPSCSCCAIVLCDLESSAYPVRAVEDGGTLLLGKLGIGQDDDALADARHRFFRVLSCARDAVVCERVLNTVNADEAYPAVMLEELLDCYREPTADGMGKDIDRVMGLPARLVPYARTAGEDALHENLALVGDGVFELGASAGRSWDLPPSGEVSQAVRDRIVLSRVDAPSGVDDANVLALLLSPSAIESYLECPYKWFAQRRLSLSEPDAGFGPLEMGSFSHGVLKSFYEYFREAGYAKVCASNLVAARELMATTFQRHLGFQCELKRNRNPLVPITELEKAEARDLERTLVAYLDREVALLPGFEPTLFEFGFGSDEPFSYAGCYLRGSIDRVDMNDRGQAVVIDYKGSISIDHALASSSPANQAGGIVLPHRVQALMYAQVVRRVLGLDVVGALYVPYGKKGRLTGAFDRMIIGAESLPDIDITACGAPGPAAFAVGLPGAEAGAASFSEVIDVVEEGIAAAVRTLAAGRIAPDPRGTDPCRYCPVLSCERRLAR